MATRDAGGCAHVHVTALAEPIDNRDCHCNVCKGVTGPQQAHVAFFTHGDIQLDHPEKIKRVPFSKDNPNGPLEICLCSGRGAALVPDDSQHRIRVAVPNVMGSDEAAFPKATCHAFRDTTKGHARPDDGRPVHDGPRPDFVWPSGARGAPRHHAPPPCPAVALPRDAAPGRAAQDLPTGCSTAPARRAGPSRPGRRSAGRACRCPFRKRGAGCRRDDHLQPDPRRQDRRLL
jgi:hypothetical protein